MLGRRLSIGQAGKKVGLCNQTLLRAERAERIRFSREGEGWRWIRESDLLKSPVLTITQASKLTGLKVSRLRRLGKKQERRYPPIPQLAERSRQRFFSLNSARIFWEDKSDSLVPHYRQASKLYRKGQGFVRRLRDTVIVTYELEG